MFVRIVFRVIVACPVAAWFAIATEMSGELMDMLPRALNESGDGVYFHLLADESSVIGKMGFDGMVSMYASNAPITPGHFVQATVPLFLV